MQLSSVRDLKSEVLETLVLPHAQAAAAPDSLSFAAAFEPGTALSRGRIEPLSVSARALKPMLHRSLAIGVAQQGKEFKLALRVQRQSLMGSKLLEQVVKKAKGEVDVRLIGRVDKRMPAQVGRRPPSRPAARAQALTAWYRDNTSPLLIGSSIGHHRVTAGTLGAFVVKDGKVCVLSNNHVLANENDATVGDAILQRAYHDGGRLPHDRVASLTQWIPLDANASNTVDAAIAEIDGRAYDVSCLREVFGGRDDKLRGVAAGAPVDGTVVHKIGRTTGPTLGRISAFDVDNVVVGYEMGNVRFDGAIEIESATSQAFSDGGDSGSLIIDDAMQALGLLFAGTDLGGSNGLGVTYANPMEAVLQALDVDLLT